MKLIEATVKYPAKIRATKYGKRISALFTLPNGEETTVWGHPGYQSLENLKRGQICTLAQDSKGSYRLIEQEESTPTPAPESSPYSLGNDQKRAIAAYVEQQAALLKFCQQTAERNFEGLSQEIVQKHTTTLFLAAQRKFGL